jgi:hypothetical protein
MASKLPSSLFDSEDSLVPLRKLMGWQTPGYESKVQRGIVSLANMWPGDFVFFSAYVLDGLVPPLSSFFLTLLEHYKLQL